MRRIEFTPKARHDIEDIWDYSLKRFGFDRAEAYLRELQRAAETVAEDPCRGVAPITTGCEKLGAPNFRRPKPAEPSPRPRFAQFV